MSAAPIAASVPVVHAVTDDLTVARGDFLDRARAVMAALGPRGALQLRAPALSGRVLYETARALAEAQERTGCWLVVNDRADVAVAAGARGVQLTSRSVAVGDVRARVVPPGFPIGASGHEAGDVRDAAAQGASWLVLSRPSGAGGDAAARHSWEDPRPIAEAAAAAPRMPLLAIGGVLPGQVAGLRRAGAHGVAAIRGIWGAPDAARAAGDYLSAYEGDRGSLDSVTRP